MSDYEDFLIEHWASLAKKKAKKDSKKAKKDGKHKKSRPKETDEGAQKKKKNSKFQEVMTEKKKEKKKGKDKDKKKEKKKKKNKLALNLDGDLAFAENGKLNSFPETSAKEAKRKKMVAFAPLPSHAHVFASSTSEERKAPGEDESRSQWGARSQVQPPDSDSQHNSDDVNSQDLFITQKTFRASPSDASGSEAGDRALSESPRLFTQRDRGQPPTAGETKTSGGASDRGRGGAPQQGLREIKTEPEEEIHQFLKRSSQTHQAAESKGPEHGGRRFLDLPLVISPTQEPDAIRRRPPYRPYTAEPARLPASANAATQTENFFTAELSSCLSFCRKKRAAPLGQDDKPLDLSLPRRAREGLCVSVKKPEEEAAECREQTAPQAKRAAIKEEPSGHVETTPSPPSEADTKSTNTTTSSEDDHHCHAGKRDLTQVRAVQLRLNKPFFFKTKGGERSPRPDSPLMKLSQGRDGKTKTCRSGRR
ncbi:uncharacterized protein LOC105929608 [Fundulus heteroclitus]|uniref:uncharacterized protein LOC105929608 n=1 Tax=Fundulus heteroclitus TaxID=8078 RepID=UPI00165BAA23|nr:uncharacterized protein LOC105929608 [Fundulus heteroclitus]